MTARTRIRLVMAALALAPGALAGAPHSVPVNFDQTRSVTIAGVLTEATWVNPHSHWRVDVTNPDGAVLEWLVEFGAKNTMVRAGFPMDRFMVGDRVEVTGYPGRRDRAVLLREVVHKGERLNPEMRPRAGGTIP
jgi:hypothetical protein